MEISDRLLCLFSAEVEEQDDTYVVEVPARELDIGDLQEQATYRVALLTADTTDDMPEEDTAATTPDQPQGPPVAEGDRRDVEIEDIGEQGDGITKVERGYVVVVPDTTKGERVTIEITNVQENVAFATVVDRHDR